MNETDKGVVLLKKSMPYIRKRYPVRRMGVFGSYSRGEQTEKSDLDILVELKEPVSLLEFMALERNLAELTGRKVDLVMRSALKPRIGKRILR